MPRIVDSHVHIIPDLLEKWGRSVTDGFLGQARKRARSWMRPFTESMHRAQTFMRLLPEPARKSFDRIGAIMPVPNLLVEGTHEDLKEMMVEAGVAHSLIIAHPPYVDSEMVLDLADEHPEFFAVVNIPSGTSRPGAVLKKYASRGARALKIHPAADGEGVDSPRYKALLKSAADLGLPVIIHTGCLHTHLLYKDPLQGQAQKFAPWFETYKDLRFILAHMNFHEPNIALDLAEEYPNLFVETSWQPMEMISEAVRRVGAERVLFGSDWPLVGNNIKVGIKRVEDCVASGMMDRAQAELILGENAFKLFELGKAE